MTGLTPEKRARFLSELRKMPNVARAARLIGIARQTMYQHRKEDAGFAAEWDEAVQEGIEALEEKAWKRAEKESDTLMIFLLKAHRPEKYRETTRHELTGKDGDPLPAPVIYLPAVADDTDGA